MKYLLTVLLLLGCVGMPSISASNHKWSLTDDKEFNRVFLEVRGDKKELELVGNSGCNQFTAKCLQKDDQVHVQQIVTTKMLCSDQVMELEQHFLKFLNGPLTLLPVGEDTLEITNLESGKKVKFGRAVK
jgi:heat shock protein HslJ